LRRVERRFEDAEPLVRESRKLFEQLEGSRGRNVAASSLDLSYILTNQGKGLDEARSLVDQAFEIYESIQDGGHPFAGIALLAKANVSDLEGRPDASEAEFGIAAERLTRHFPGSPYLAEAFVSLGSFEEARGAKQEAEQHYRRALSIFEATGDARSHDIDLTRHHLAELFFDQGRHAEALPLAEQALCEPPWCSPEASGMARYSLAKIQAELEQLDAASSNYKKAVAGLEAALDGGTNRRLELVRAAYTKFQQDHSD
jgi:tetratricopeptide (TPR) repeat protein